MNCELCDREMRQVGEPYFTAERILGEVRNTDYACVHCLDVLTGPPAGYKPVTHRGCGGQLAWALDTVVPHTPIRATDILDVNGHPVDPMGKIGACPKCGLNPGAMGLAI